jgi:hypothetical protein
MAYKGSILNQDQWLINHIAHLTGLHYVDWKQKIVFPLPRLIRATTAYHWETSWLLSGSATQMKRQA